MKIKEAVEQLGITVDGNLALCIVRIPPGKGPTHYLYNECSNKPVTDNMYIGSALFKPDTITRSGGRTEANIARILYLPFDFDFADYLGCAKEDVWNATDDELDEYITAVRIEVEEQFRTIGLPIHALIFTGYGLAAWTFLPPHGPEAVQEIRRLHKQIVTRINLCFGGKLADPQVSDAGTRIMRLVPSPNTKGAIPRIPRIIYRIDGTVDEVTLRRAANDTNRPPARVVAKTGKRLGDADADAIVTALAPYWTLGQKHWMSLALAGMLAKAGVSEEQAEAIVDQLAANDDRPDDRRNSVHDTYEKYRSGLTLQGYTSLRQMLPEDVLAYVDGILEKIRQATTSRVTVGNTSIPLERTELPQDAPEFIEAPDVALTSWIGRYVDLMFPTTEAPIAFHLGVGLTLIGALLGRRVSMRYGSDPLYPNLYTLLVGPSGNSRKDTAIKRATRILTDPHHQGTRLITPETKVKTDVGSAEGLISILKENPNTLLYLTEFSKLMGNARRKGTQTIIPTLIEAWDTPPVLATVTRVAPQEALYPYLSILSGTQPDILANLMSDEDMHSGFANRWLYVCGTGSGPMPVPPPVDKVAREKLVLDLLSIRQSYAEGTELELAADAQERWNDWYIADYTRASRTPEEDAMRVRHAVLIQKIALTYAVTDQAQAIYLHHLEPALAVVEWMWRNVSQLMGDWGRSIDGLIEQKIIDVLTARGPMKRRDLQRSCQSRKWSARDFSATFKAMAENGTLIVDPTGLVGIDVS